MTTLPFRTLSCLFLLALLSSSSAFVPLLWAPRISVGDPCSPNVAHNALPSTRTVTCLHATKKLKREDSLSSPDSFDHALHKTRMLFRVQLAILGYMLSGVVAFSRIFERWPIIDSLYFSVVTFTTVGYGDLCPSTDAGKLFTIFYSFAGISIIGALLGIVGGSIIEAERAAIRKTRAAARAAIMELFVPKKNRRKSKAGNSDEESSAESRVTNALSVGENSSGNSNDGGGLVTLRGIFSNLFSLRKGRDGSKSLLRSAFDVVTDTYYIFVPFLTIAAVIGKREGWNTITSAYYAMATASTVGYGDVSASSPQMRLLSILFIPLAVISLGEILGRIAGFFIRKNMTQAEKEFMSRRMTLDDLDAMDTDKNG